MSDWRLRLALATLLALYVGLFVRTIRYDYVWDDVHTLRDSDFFDRPLSEQLRVTETERIDPAFLALNGIAPGHESYRPVTFLSQDIDVRLFGRGSPAPMHVHALILGALTILLVFALSRRLLGEPWPAFAVAAIFALHPLHVEPFAYVSARADLVAGMLALAALWCVTELEGRGRPARILFAIGAALLFLASLFAKEATLGLPLVAFALALALRKVRAWAPGWIALGATVAVYVVLRHLLIPDAPAATQSAIAVHAAAALPSLTLQYLGSFVLPFDISNSRLPHLPIAAGWGAIAVIALGLAFAWRTRRLGPRASFAAASLASSVFLLGPSAVAVATLGAMACRYAYLSTFAFALGAVVVARAVWDRGGGVRRGVAMAAAVWAALLVFVTHREIPAWASNEVLYSHAVAVEPGSAMAQFRLGVLRVGAGQWEEATALFETAAALDPTNERVLNNLAVGYMNLGRASEAEPVLRRVLALTNNTSFRAWYNLGTIQRQRGAIADACASFQRALTVSPEYGRARDDLARYCP